MANEKEVRVNLESIETLEQAFKDGWHMGYQRAVEQVHEVLSGMEQENDQARAKLPDRTAWKLKTLNNPTNVEVTDEVRELLKNCSEAMRCIKGWNLAEFNGNEFDEELKAIDKILKEKNI